MRSVASVGCVCLPWRPVDLLVWVDLGLPRMKPGKLSWVVGGGGDGLSVVVASEGGGASVRAQPNGAAFCTVAMSDEMLRKLKTRQQRDDGTCDALSQRCMPFPEHPPPVSFTFWGRWRAAWSRQAQKATAAGPAQRGPTQSRPTVPDLPCRPAVMGRGIDER